MNPHRNNEEPQHTFNIGQSFKPFEIKTDAASVSSASFGHWNYDHDAFVDARPILPIVSFYMGDLRDGLAMVSAIFFTNFDWRFRIKTISCYRFSN